MSDREVPESVAFRHLEHVVRHLGEELAGFRRRAHAAEGRVRALEAAVEQGGDSVSLERLRVLEDENVDLRARLAFATDRTQQLLARIRFLRQQQARPLPAGGAPAPSAGRV